VEFFVSKLACLYLAELEKQELVKFTLLQNSVLNKEGFDYDLST
jgi:hypothetical protein